MVELINLLNQISRDYSVIKDCLVALTNPKKDSFSEKWVDGQDVMFKLHISKRTLQGLRDSGSIPYSRINGKFYYKVEDLDAILEANYSHLKTQKHGNK